MRNATVSRLADTIRLLQRAKGASVAIEALMIRGYLDCATAGYLQDKVNADMVEAGENLRDMGAIQD